MHSIMFFQKFFKNSGHSSIHLLKCPTKGCAITKVRHYSTNNIVQRCVKCIITSALNHINFHISSQNSENHEEVNMLNKLLDKPNEIQYKLDFFIMF